MMPHDPKDDLANDWLNGYVDKLRFEQDYYIFPGSSKQMHNDKGENTGISIKRPDIRLYSTGVTKLYEMIVEGKEYPAVKYTEEEEKRFEENMKERFQDIADEYIDRIEVIDETGRAYVKGAIYGSPVEVELSRQDDGKTLKVFVKKVEEETQS